jgi:hypothetical protein
MWQNVFLYSVVECVLYVVECVVYSVVECVLFGRMCSF